MDEFILLIKGLPGYSSLSDQMKQRALDGAQIPDSECRYPGDPGYEPTYDVYFAALTVLPFLEAQPVVTNSSSEGTSVSVSLPNWRNLALYYRSQSQIVGLNGNAVLQVVGVPGGPHVRKVEMNDKGVDYGDINTTA